MGDDSEVNGEGVVGQQPVLEPGDAHEYKSYCVLKSPVGYMEGHYTFERPDGSRFKVWVPRFSLAAFLPGPDEAEMHLCAAGGCYSTRMPASALLHFKEFVIDPG